MKATKYKIKQNKTNEQRPPPSPLLPEGSPLPTHPPSPHPSLPPPKKKSKISKIMVITYGSHRRWSWGWGRHYVVQTIKPALNSTKLRIMLLSFLQCNEPTCYTLLFYGNYSLIKSKNKLLIDNIKTNIQNIAFLTLKMTWEKK